MELVCPAGSIPALKAAIAAGADAVYIGFKDDTNARSFAGLNFTDTKAQKALQLARSGQGMQKPTKLFVAINTFPQTSGWSRWQRAVDQAADLGIDAIIAGDLAVLEYVSHTYPEIHLHLSVQASATNRESLAFYHTNFGIRRAVLPRVLSMAQLRHLSTTSPVDLEVFGFGSLCIMAEGRCYLSSYVTDQSPNTGGVCSPPKDVQWSHTPRGQETHLNGVLIDRFNSEEKAGYPTLCKGRFDANGTIYHALEEPTSLNTLDLLPELQAMGIKAIKLEGRQRSPAYISQVTKIWRQAIDRLAQPNHNQQDPNWHTTLAQLSEGHQTTLGAYHRPWQ
ncbi:MAG: U32 family peptidase [Oceanospirillaceae bacterium]|jgi:putative protease|nr:U32 family peptidase [Oceanospirillaceae bacterium]MBT4444023.1 U32 family peptidase [Oceanospirillaceae bacterium]MBT6077544.1 U32 family peptidase [Oceanospirillaceae bacterium]